MDGREDRPGPPPTDSLREGKAEAEGLPDAQDAFANTGPVPGAGTAATPATTAAGCRGGGSDKGGASRLAEEAAPA